MTSQLSFCKFSETITAKPMVANGTSFIWQYNGDTLSVNATYTPELSDFGQVSGNYIVKCLMKRLGCTEEKLVNVNIPVITVVASTAVSYSNCGSVIFEDKRDEQKYCTKKVGDQCWMGDNLNYGVMGSTKYCYNDQLSNCNVYGGLYTWALAMNGETSSDKVPSGVEGICPQGWHIPSYTEWQTAIINMNAELGVFFNIPTGYYYSPCDGVYRPPFVLGSSTSFNGGSQWHAAYSIGDPKKIIIGTYDGNFCQYVSSVRNAYSIRCVKD